jgi:hypothetical protein
MCPRMHGASAMNKKSATEFKSRMELAIRELSSALVLAQAVSTPEEFTAIRKSIGDLIAAVDALLYDSIYPDHPELNQLRNG